MEAKGVSRRSAGGLEDYLAAIFLAERAGGIGLGIGGEESCELGCGGIDCVPPVAVGIKDNRAGAEDLLDAVRIFSCDADNHVDEFGGAEGLADERADADELGVVFGVFDGDLGREGHGDSLGKSGRRGKRGKRVAPKAHDEGSVVVATRTNAVCTLREWRNAEAFAALRMTALRPVALVICSAGGAVDEWRRELGRRRGRVLDAPLLRFISRASRFDDLSVIRIWELGGRGLCRSGLCHRWSCPRGGPGRL
jgi:hypothetical protein